MMMLNGESFTGNSGFSYKGGVAQSVGPADVRRALMEGWVPIQIGDSAPWAPMEANPLVAHLNAIDAELADVKAQLAALKKTP